MAQNIRLVRGDWFTIMVMGGWKYKGMLLRRKKKSDLAINPDMLFEQNITQAIYSLLRDIYICI